MYSNRHSIRLKDFDYSNNGYYFVTICVQDKLKLFWNDKYIINDREDTGVLPYKINNIGLMINFWLNEIQNHFKNVIIDEYIIMPDHIHFILIINNYLGRTHRSARTSNAINQFVGVDRCVDPKLLGNIIQWFKTMSTNEYIKNIKLNNWPRLNKRLWQRNYYEHIIRNEKEYLRIREYIKMNPRV